jgi:hypothetical protein
VCCLPPKYILRFFPVWRKSEVCICHAFYDHSGLTWSSLPLDARKYREPLQPEKHRSLHVRHTWLPCLVFHWCVRYFSCNGTRVVYNASLIWGTIGPQRMFQNGQVGYRQWCRPWRWRFSIPDLFAGDIQLTHASLTLIFYKLDHVFFPHRSMWPVFRTQDRHLFFLSHVLYASSTYCISATQTAGFVTWIFLYCGSPFSDLPSSHSFFSFNSAGNIRTFFIQYIPLCWHDY